ncbi:bifunctional alpha/beta hydrolase/OsmC family protein [Pleionea sp. CnH1-48]|uniref:bifunctional alpha/beta hydrolase/OsmC family protein n=1 Tax=Pleionea sp. CnH1-48 TaxID=2954494 RepID=UPI00209742EF|nr:bifunctional alpha/beta hydrolase/OsmC family protein [Pleionea sp. CnH1-48]MCO7223538.1 bifunctional alpha/beta hydrolase/OsmC family protein [Pleionea sp. CnH1-48]
MKLQRKKFTFVNEQGIELSALLEMPANEPRGFALFAHCFTCGKDISSASRIARALAARDIAVLRFDFTGLGSSDGDFANSNFSTNVQDLIAAAEHLRRDYLAPVLLIGHSLGGAAVLAAAEQIPECKAVVTIGAPSDPEHVQKQFACDIDDIVRQGSAQVSLAGRPFVITKQFLDDIESQSLAEKIAHLKKALLVFHSPQDATVSINEAAKIYQAAKHPKSFVSLDNADHLLTRKEDAEYVANTISEWVSRYLPDDQPVHKNSSLSVSGGQVVVKEKNKQFLRDIVTDDHFFQADEPIRVGGSNLGPDPYELLLASLGACTSMTIRMYANRKKIPLVDLDVSLSHSREHLKDCENCDDAGNKMDVIERYIRFYGDELTAEQRQRLLEIADRCPVHKTLMNMGEIRTFEAPSE